MAKDPIIHESTKNRTQSTPPPAEPEASSTSKQVINTPHNITRPSSAVAQISLTQEDAIKHELERKKLLEIPGLIEHLFSADRVVIVVGLITRRVLDSSPSSWDAISCRWDECLDLEIGGQFLSDSARSTRGAERVSAFLNLLTDQIYETYTLGHSEGIDKPRRWHCVAQIPSTREDALVLGSPQLVLTADTKTSWKSILASAAFRPKEEDHQELFTQLSHDAWMAFSNQDDRRFFTCVSFAGFDIRMFVFDRSGVVGSQVFNFNTRPALFLRLLTGLLLGWREDIGLDPTIFIDAPSGRFVNVVNVEYEILETIFVSDALVGSGTVCWRARPVQGNGADVVIKNIWADEEGGTSEEEIMVQVGDVEGVVRMIANEVVLVNNEEDTTDNIRLAIPDDYPAIHKMNDIDIRALHRMVITPYAQGISHFSSKQELVSVFIDGLQAHRRLLQKGILHSDISLENIMIYEPPLRSESSENDPKQTTWRRGLLIDLGCAIRFPVLSEDQEARGIYSNTLPFFETETTHSDSDSASAPNDLQNKIQQDLEPFLYVLIWLCWYYVGPDNALREEFSVKTMGQQLGVPQNADSVSHSDSDWEDIGIYKFAPMCTENAEDTFTSVVLHNFSPYFRDLKTCVTELRQLMFGRQGAKATHDEMIAVLEKTRDVLPAEGHKRQSNGNDQDQDQETFEPEVHRKDLKRRRLENDREFR